jgi:4-hydroxybenzoate polyprenyltransferase
MRHYPAVPARGLRRFNRRYGERTSHNLAIAAVWILVFLLFLGWRYWHEVVGVGLCLLGAYIFRRVAKRR